MAITGRSPQKNAAIAGELADRDAIYTLDVRDEAAVERVFAQVVERFGRLDILVNNAGTVRVDLAVNHKREDWDEVIETNLTGAFLCARHAARIMIDGGRGGKIINIGSVTASFGPPDFASYAASKAGMRGLTSALAVEFAPHNIQVNDLEPGYFDTDLSSGRPDWLRDMTIRKTPAGRFGQPHELVGAAVFLASSASDFVTGTILRVDGGYSIADRLRYDPVPGAPPEA